MGNFNNSVTIKLEPNEDLIAIVASGPYMANNSIQSDSLELLIDMVKAKNAHVLILVTILDCLKKAKKRQKIIITNGLISAWSIC